MLISGYIYNSGNNSDTCHYKEGRIVLRKSQRLSVSHYDSLAAFGLAKSVFPCFYIACSSFFRVSHFNEITRYRGRKQKSLVYYTKDLFNLKNSKFPSLSSPRMPEYRLM